MSSLEASGVHAVAISADTSEESRELCRKAKLTFPILSDPDAQTIRQYDLLVKSDGKGGRDIAGPAEFLLDSSGTVRWRQMNETSAEQFVNAAKALN